MEMEAAFYREKVVPATKLHGVTVMKSLMTGRVRDREQSVNAV